MASILQRCIVVQDGKFSLAFRISSIDITVPSLQPVVAPQSLGDSILKTILNDTAHEDVVFCVDNPSNSSAPEVDYSFNPDIVVDMDMNVKTTDDDKSALGSNQEAISKE